MKKIKYTLSAESIDNAIREIEKYKAELNVKISELIQALTDYGVNVAKAQVIAMNAFYTGDLEANIVGYFSPSTGVGIIRAGTPYAVYVEYGTGVIGRDSHHPNPDGWEYDINAHGEDGWWYFNDRDGKVHWTKGMASRPFMYNTARELERSCAAIAKGIFNK